MIASKDIAAPLLAWYDEAHRNLPWRTPPASMLRADPYRVWLSEIMLQQTTVAAVIPYFERFTTRWPDVTALAAAGDAELMAAWAGLGYYARARNLIACARIIVSDYGGRFPETEAELVKLPGIGTYTAAAIAAIAFDEAAVVVDGNVERVVARLFAVETPLPAAKTKLRTLAASLTPATRPGDYAQAMMDLGAGICRPKSPDCNACPLTAHCDAHSANIAADLPRRAPKAARPVRHACAYWLEHEGDVLLVRRPPKGLLGGMLALPSSEFAPTPDAAGESGAPLALDWGKPLGRVRHIFTHFELHMDVYAASTKGKRLEGEWTRRSDVLTAGLPTAFHKAAKIALKSRNKT